MPTLTVHVMTHSRDLHHAACLHFPGPVPTEAY